VYQNVKELEERLSGLRVRNEEEVESYSRLWDQLASLSQQFHAFLTRPQYIVPFLQPGRLVKVQEGCFYFFLWGGGSVGDP
jgi:ATP-dependent RNA helicase DOB1